MTELEKIPSGHVWLRRFGKTWTIKVGSENVKVTWKGGNSCWEALRRNWDGQFECEIGAKHFVLSFPNRESVEVVCDKQSRNISLAWDGGLIEGGGYVVNLISAPAFSTQSLAVVRFHENPVFELKTENVMEIIRNFRYWRKFLKGWELYGKIYPEFYAARDLPVLFYLILHVNLRPVFT